MGWSFYISLALLAPFPVIMGVLDTPEKILNYLDRRRAGEHRRVRHATWIQDHGVGFLRKLDRFNDMEVWLMSETLIHGKNRLARRREDPAIGTLRRRGYVEAASALDFSGFPFYFTEKAWCLMTAYEHDIIAERERRRGTGLTSTMESSLHDTLTMPGKVLIERPN